MRSRHRGLFRSAKFLRSEDGIGMVELVVAMGLAAVLLGIAGAMFTSAWTHTANLEREVIAQTDARSVLNQIHDEIRQAYTGQAGLSPVESLTSTSITFYSPNRDTNFKLRKITYQLTGTNLTRSEVLSTNTASPWSIPGGTPTAITVLTNVRAPGGSPAIDAIFTGTGSPIRTVSVKVTIDADTTKAPAAQKYETAAHVRVTPT